MDTVTSILKSNRYLHLGTCSNNIPNVSLMNYIYIDGVVVLATPKDTTKLSNIEANENVSILVHELMSEGDESLSEYLKRLNQSHLSPQKSATILGKAHVVTGAKAEQYAGDLVKEHPDAKCFIDKSSIVVVQPTSVRLADSSNKVNTFVWKP